MSAYVRLCPVMSGYVRLKKKQHRQFRALHAEIGSEIDISGSKRFGDQKQRDGKVKPASHARQQTGEDLELEAKKLAVLKFLTRPGVLRTMLA